MDNIPEIKKLTNTPDLQEEQLKWFNSLKFKDNYLIWELWGCNHVGACGL
jgi:hypothetical protein